MPARNEAWERVLAAVAADVRRAEELLRAPVTAAPAPDADSAAVPAGIPADWLLPSAHDPELPPLSEMPPVPPALAERIVTLRDQIAGLQDELRAAMAQVRARPQRLPVATPPRRPAAVYLDRRL